MPKIQILSIEEPLGGRKPELPDLPRGAQTFKKAALEQGDGRKQQSDLGF